MSPVFVNGDCSCLLKILNMKPGNLANPMLDQIIAPGCHHIWEMAIKYVCFFCYHYT